MKPIAIMVDIDGTLAHMKDRSPYDPTKYHTDTVDDVVKELVNMYHNVGYKIVLCSGRDDTYMKVTREWLKANEIKYNELYMRDPKHMMDGKKSKDHIVKQEIYEQYIQPNYTIRFVLDDRNRVVEMWRSLGLKVLQVEPGDF